MNIKSIIKLQTEEINQAKKVTTKLNIPLMQCQNGNIEIFDDYLIKKLKN